VLKFTLTIPEVEVYVVGPNTVVRPVVLNAVIVVDDALPKLIE